VATPINIPAAILASLTGMAEERLSEDGFRKNRITIQTDWKKRPTNGEAEFHGNNLISFKELETEVLHQDSSNITYMKQYIVQYASACKNVWKSLRHHYQDTQCKCRFRPTQATLTTNATKWHKSFAKFRIEPTH
jgi:hypothetical protein